MEYWLIDENIKLILFIVIFYLYYESFFSEIYIIKSFLFEYIRGSDSQNILILILKVSNQETI